MNKHMTRKIVMFAVAAMAACVLAQSPAQPKAATPTTMAVHLKQVEGLLKGGNADRALADIQANLSKYTTVELAEALSLRARAKVMLAEKASDAAGKNKLLLEGALDYLRVATFFSYSPEAADSMYQASKACAAAGDVAGARSALEQVIARFPDSDVCKQAQRDLAAMK